MNLGEESEYIEHKLSTSELSEALQAMSGMLNKHGYGTIYFGVADNGDAIGFPCGKDTENDIQKRISQKMDPAPTVSTTLTRIGDGTKGIIEVKFSGNRPPYQFNGRFYMRNSRADDPMDASELEQYILSRRKNYVSWENAEGSQSLANMSEHLVAQVYEASKEIHREYTSYPGVEKTLRFFGLLTKNGQPNNAAVALFGKRPLTLKTATYRSFDRSEASDMDVVKGNIIELISLAMDYVLNHIDSVYVNVGTLSRETVPEIPKEALREIIVNAFAHADYSSNTSHQVFIFKDRVSIYNPGYFPVGLKPEDYETEGVDPIERNPKIYDILHCLGFVETYATGLRKTFSVCQKTRTTTAYEQTTQGGFRFEFFRKGDAIFPPFPSGASDEEKLLSILSRNSFLSLEDLASKIGKGKVTTHTKISNLVSEGKVKRVGSDKTGRWVVIRK